jgi:DNA-binding NarL/FixJ family response regulator
MTGTTGLKLLIADDHAGMRQTLRSLLSLVASDIREATDGGEAVRLYADQHSDWVIMDIQMKPIGGLAATRTIRERFPTARIVIVTQYDDAELRAEAAKAGACAYILKDELATLTRLIEPGSNPHGTSPSQNDGNLGS